MAAKATVPEIISVEFIDNTNYQQNSTSTDVVGDIIDHVWGPVNQKLVLTQSEFLNYYPLYPSIPYANAYRALQAGARYVEVYRPQAKDTYMQFVVSETADAFTIKGERTAVGAAKYTTSIAGAVMVISLKYPGWVPETLFAYTKLGVSVTLAPDTANPVTISLLGYAAGATDPVTVAIYQGSFNPEDVVDGQPFFIETVVANSAIISCHVISTPTGATTDPLVVDSSSVDTPDAPYVHTPLTAADIEPLYGKLWASAQTSAATILIPALPDSTVYAAVTAVAAKRMDLTALVGIGDPATAITTYFNADDPVSEMQTYLGTLTKNMFSGAYFGVESVTVANKQLLLDGTAGVAGRICSVANSVRTNQLPSADSYGSFPGTLAASLDFPEVLSLQELGANSIYTAESGSQIWGIRSLHDRQTSYFGKFNVSRVLASVLRFTFKGCWGVIHTDVAANPLTRSSFQTSLQTLLDNQVAAQNLKNGSEFVMSDELNTDAATQGGAILRIDLYLAFIGLTERVHIRVIATDTTVSAQII